MKTTPEQIDLITRHYLICALWSSTDDEGEPMDSGRDLNDIADETKVKAREDVADFLELLEREGVAWSDHWTPEQMGHDLWLTRNGHGTGFWDRYGVCDETGYAMGQTLDKWAQTYGGVDLFVGDDGKVHH